MNHPHNHTHTSIAAAQSLTHPHAQREAIYQALKAAGVNGLTRQELQRTTGISGDAIRPRVWQMIKDQIVCESGEVRLTDSGNQAMVLVLK